MVGTRSIFLLLPAFLLLCPAAGQTAGAEDTPAGVRQPQMTFQLERKRFYWPGADLSTTTTMRTEATEESFHEQGYTPGHLDEPSGLAYATRRSIVDIRVTDEGEMLYLERMPADAPSDYSDHLHQLFLPVGPEPNKTINPLMALHPFTMITPEFEVVRELNEPDILSRDETPELEVITTPDWIYRIHRDPETGRVHGIEQVVADQGWLFRETLYEDYHEAPSGRVIPGRVVTRTHFEGRVPYAELVFEKIVENEAPRFSVDPFPHQGQDD